MNTVICRACDGDGILAADDETPPHERVTPDSRRCNYCGGKGHVRREVDLTATRHSHASRRVWIDLDHAVFGKEP